jgi:hypothetical protein
MGIVEGATPRDEVNGLGKGEGGEGTLLCPCSAVSYGGKIYINAVAVAVDRAQSDEMHRI